MVPDGPWANCSYIPWAPRWAPKCCPEGLGGPRAVRNQYSAAMWACMRRPSTRRFANRTNQGSWRIFFILEQPRGSLMEWHPRFQEFIKSHKLYRVCVEMGRFGAQTAKPSWLYSAHEFIQELPNYQGAKSYQPGQNMLVDMVKTSDGTVQINGNHRMKGSQAYPKAFGKA
eukprot:2644902-Pyramimonas_sp.AAC.1